MIQKKTLTVNTFPYAVNLVSSGQDSAFSLLQFVTQNCNAEWNDFYCIKIYAQINRVKVIEIRLQEYKLPLNQITNRIQQIRININQQVKNKTTPYCVVSMFKALLMTDKPVMD